MKVNLSRSCCRSILAAMLLSGLPAAFAQQAPQPNVITGVGTANATAAISNFRAAIGGIDNGGNPVGQTSGRREINWDGVKLDGTDFNGDSLGLIPGKTIGIPTVRFQSRGVQFDQIYAVSNDGFASANPGIAGQFPAFSPNNVFAPFFNLEGRSGHTIDMAFVVPSVPNSTNIPALVKGFGAVFIGVDSPNTTSIEYFNNSRSLGKFFVPTGPRAQPEFLGVLFPNANVTRVTITLGNAQIFSFSNNTVIPTPITEGQDMVVTDDFIYSEPIAAFQPVDIAVGSDNSTWILYGTPDGRGAVQVVDNSGNIITQNTFGPFPGDAPLAIAVGADKIARILWRDGVVFGLDTNAQFIGQLNLPAIPGMQYQDIAVSSTNQNLLLLTNSDGSAAEVMVVDNHQTTMTQTNFGPFPGATAVAIAGGSDGIIRLLWQDNGTSTNNATVFGLDATGTIFLGQLNLPDIAGSFQDISVAPDNTNRVLIANQDGSFSVWTITNQGAITNQMPIGPFAFFSETAMDTGPDGLSRVLVPSTLWNPTATGETGVALVNPNGTLQNSYTIGDF